MHYRIEQGLLRPARQLPSVNFDQRPADCEPSLLVVHNISLPPGCYGGPFIEALFCNNLDCDADPFFAELRDLQVSAHLLLDRDGAITQFVNFDQRAWHAGASHFQGRENCNDFSIGIELEGCDDDPFADAQYRQLAAVTAALIAHYPSLNSDRIVGHSDIAPGRKTDPGVAFDWPRYRAELTKTL